MSIDHVAGACELLKFQANTRPEADQTLLLFVLFPHSQIHTQVLHLIARCVIVALDIQSVEFSLDQREIYER